jgi:uncharacterized protein YjbJ (UPF0337 family)
MNADILKGKWKQIQGEAKKWWGDLTDDELTKVDGERDKLSTQTEVLISFRLFERQSDNRCQSA